jgi:hypothetical protein
MERLEDAWGRSVARLLGQRSKFRKVDVPWWSKANEKGREQGLCLGETKDDWGFWYRAGTGWMERGGLQQYFPSRIS